MAANPVVRESPLRELVAAGDVAEAAAANPALPESVMADLLGA